MKKKAFGLIFSIMVAILSLVVCLPKSSVLAATLAQNKTSNYLLDDVGAPYESNIEAGEATGYGEYLLGDQNIDPITATAFEGFYIVGWRVTFTEVVSASYSVTRKCVDVVIEDNESIFKQSSFSITYLATEGQSFDVGYEIENVDTNEDGYCDKSILKISQIVENITIDPVFDYIYTNIDVTDLIQLVDLTTYHTVSQASADADLLYLSNATDDGKTKYQNSLLVANGKYYYFGDVYCDDGSTEFYTLNTRSPKIDDGKQTQNVLLSQGRYRLDEEVSFSLTFNVSDDFLSGFNIDVTGLNLTIDESSVLIEKTGDNNYQLTQDQYNRSKNISVNLNIQTSKNQLLVLTICYDELYIATIIPQIDNLPAGENESFIYDALSIEKTSYFSQIEAKRRYFVKNPTTSNTSGFKLSANEKIISQGYEYYDFDSLTSSNAIVTAGINKNNLNLTGAIDTNFEINVNYKPVLYNVSFKFALYDASSKKFMCIDGDFNIENTLKLERGKTSALISKTDASNNVGYNFVGFVDEQNTFNLTVNDSFIFTDIYVTIHETQPVNKTILMLFVEKEYQLKLNNINSIKLNNGLNDIFPISSMAMSVNRAGNLSSALLSNLNTANLTESFDKTLKIGDVVKVVATVNKGFVLKGFGYSADIKTFNGVDFEINLTQEFLTSYDQANTNIIDIFDFEDYQTYSLTYTLNGALNGADEKVIMADLSVIYNGTVYNKTNFTDSIKYIEIGSEKAQFVLSNLKLYEQVKLVSTAKSINNDDTEPYYLFNRYTENFQTNFTLTETNPASMIYTVQKDIEIFVVYSLPGLKLQLSVDNELAYDLNQTLQQGTTYLTDADNTPVDFVTTELQPSKRYILTLNDAFKFGYALLGYNYNGTTYLASSLSNPLVFEFSTLNTTQIHNIEILTKELKFNFNVSYANSVDDTPTFLQTFDDISVSNLHLEFSTPEGYFVSQVYFVNSLGNNRYQKAEYTNDYAFAKYIYDFTSEELENLINSYGIENADATELNMLVIYSLHSYQIKVVYSLVSSKDMYDQRVSFPNITMTADGQKVSYTDDNGARIFFGIPYGKAIVLTADSNYEEGMSPFGWVYEKQLGYSSNLTQLTIDKLTANQVFEYKLNYNVYTIKIEKTGNTKQPIVVITNPATNQTTDKISRFDSLSIDMNADKQNGWRFINMYYFKYEYQTYTYDQATFDTTELYIFENNRYVLNTADYDETMQYYTKEKVQVDYSAFSPYRYTESSWTSSWNSLFVLNAGDYKRNGSSEYDINKQYYIYSNTKFEDNSFQAGNYLAEVDENNVYSITFYIVYDYIDISLNIKASINGTNSLDRGDLSVLPIDYANITFSVINNDNQERLLSIPYSVSIIDNLVRLTLKLQTITVDRQEYSLSNGVKLVQAFVGDKTVGMISVIDKGSGVYVMEFYVATMLNNNCLSNNDSFEIYLTYQIQNKRMELSTSIEADDFYRDTTGNTIFSMSNDQLAYGFGAGSSSSRGASKMAVDFQFLGKVYVSYAFIQPYQEYNQYFKISGIKVYKLNSSTNVFGYITYSKGDLIKTTSAEQLKVLGITNANFAQYFDYRFIDNLFIELQVQPVIKINGDGNKFNFTFNCDNLGNGIEQDLAVGQDSSCHIEMAEILQQYLDLTYHKNIIQNGVIIGYSADNAKLIDAGTYLVSIAFKGYGNWAWLTNLKYDNDVFVVIAPKTIELKVNTDTFNRKEAYVKDYEGKNVYNFDKLTDLLNYVYISDGSRTYPYTDTNDNLRLILSKLDAKICYINNDTLVYSGIATRDGELFSILLSGLEIQNTNFQLKKDSLLFENAIKINKKEITLSGIKVYDKVYDGTDVAEFKIDEELKWLGLIAGDIVSAPQAQDLDLRFEKDAYGNAKIGYNINIIIDASKVLKGDDADNYKIKVNGTTATVYPYSVSTNVEGFGKIEVRNDKGLIKAGVETRHDLAGLIPVNAELKVEVIYADSPEYVAIYPNISGFINRNHNFAVGYKIYLNNNNVTTKLNNNLTLILPNIERLTNLALVNENDAVELTYDLKNDCLIVDLSQTNFEALKFAVIQQRILFKSWQLILIISLVMLILVVAVIVFIIVRKRKKERYSVNEKI